MNIGEDVKFVCIINDAIDRVHWEKDGKKVGVKKKQLNFAAFLTTNNHQNTINQDWLDSSMNMCILTEFTISVKGV